MKLFVGNLSWNTDDQSLREAFESFGEIASARVITDRETGRSRGFGFVEFVDSSAGEEAQQNMDGKEIDGREVKVNEARERAPRSGGFRR